MFNNIFQRIIAAGNPGAGKSTILNHLAGMLLFQSGVSMGGGLTFQLDRRLCNGIELDDTPGLSCTRHREAAATAIKEALDQGGPTQMLFVVKEDDGRVRTSDVTTLKMILEACTELENKYGILVNQVEREVMRKLEDPANRALFEASLFDAIPDRVTAWVCYVEKNADLKSKDDILLPADEHINGLLDGMPVNVKAFVANLPKIDLSPGMCGDIPHDSFEDLQKRDEDRQEEIKQLREDAERGDAEAKVELEQTIAACDAAMAEQRAEHEEALAKAKEGKGFMEQLGQFIATGLSLGGVQWDDDNKPFFGWR